MFPCFSFDFWLGATRKVGKTEINWISNDEAVDFNHPAWETDPRIDVGQFLPTESNVSCVMATISEHFSAWGIKGRGKARSLCEKQVH